MSGSSDDAPAPQDDPISPSTFVEHIRELGEKRDREDQERNRLLEEQILQGRAERAARRAGVYLSGRCLYFLDDGDDDDDDGAAPVTNSPRCRTPTLHVA